MTKEERARLAKEVLENALYKDIWTTLEERALTKWKNTAITDVATREECFSLYASLQAHKEMARRALLYGVEAIRPPTKRAARRRQAKENEV